MPDLGGKVQRFIRETGYAFDWKIITLSDSLTIEYGIVDKKQDRQHNQANKVGQADTKESDDRIHYCLVISNGIPNNPDDIRENYPYKAQDNDKYVCRRPVVTPSRYSER